MTSERLTEIDLDINHPETGYSYTVHAEYRWVDEGHDLPDWRTEMFLVRAVAGDEDGNDVAAPVEDWMLRPAREALEDELAYEARLRWEDGT
jgi:hypothetical protein